MQKVSEAALIQANHTIKWNKLSDSDLNRYQNCTDRFLKSCLAEVNVLTCNDPSCTNVEHHRKK